MSQKGKGSGENGWITTYTGKKFYPLSPNPEDVDILDIAHALSLMCRFNGHCRVHYSVAQHSVHASLLGQTRQVCLWGLLHDAAEAYLPDVCRPVKMAFKHFKEWEENILNAVAARYYLPFPTEEEQKEIKRIDNQLVVTEGRDLLRGDISDWTVKAKPLDIEIFPKSPKEAEEEFLLRWIDVKDIK